MNKREAKRRARMAAADVLHAAIANGWELEDLTDDGSKEQTDMIEAALREIIAMLSRPNRNCKTTWEYL